MTWVEFAIIAFACSLTMLICRVVPIFALKGRALPENGVRLLNLIPPATFSALIANDLLDPSTFSSGLWPGAAPLLAAVLVFIVGYKSKSLVWCIVVGIVAYAALSTVSLPF